MGLSRPYNLLVRRLLLLALSLVTAAAAAQTPDEPPPSFSESAGAEYVMLPVVVTGKDGKFVDGLTKNDFVVRVEESRVDFDTFERDQTAPVSFAFLVDTSGSMGVGGKLENAKNAIRSIQIGRAHV